MARRKPYPRRRAASDGRRRDPWDLIRALEHAASTYGWTAEHIYQRETKERVLAYLDAARERLDDEFRASVDAARIGYILAHDATAYRRWNASRKRATATLPDAALEAAIMRLGEMFPGTVTRVSA